jgi:hypothetical protein
VLLEWAPVINLDNGSPIEDIAGYNVYRSEEKGGKPAPINTAPVMDARFEDTAWSTTLRIIIP